MITTDPNNPIKPIAPERRDHEPINKPPKPPSQR